VQEKRRHERVPVRIPIRCEVSGGETFDAVVVDLSVGGFYVESTIAPPFGSNVTLTGDFPGSPGVKLPAVVRWGKPGGFGVQFGLLGARETHLLASMVQKGRV
jgi:hypothetical protein